MTTYEDYTDADVFENDLSETIPSSQLQWPGASSEQLRFMRRVYDINLQRNVAAGRTFVADVPTNELATIEGRYQARTAAAADCTRLLTAVRREISSQNRPVQVGLTSAYRSASEQLRLWQRYFTETNGYYERTASQRRSQPDGEHSEAAAQQTAAFVRGRIGTPGFSNHNDALAVDFLNVVNGSAIPNKTTTEATQQWRQTWFWGWLVANAQTYNFYQNTAINEPWHWEYRAQAPQPAVEIADVWGADIHSTSTPSIWDEEEDTQPDGSNLGETGGGTFRRLREQDVHYLSFEGGGGKGFVFVGAIRALQAKGILRFSNGRLDPAGQIKGISGASAGAITALLLSIGYDADAITALMRSNNFNRFFDLPGIPSRIPQINGCRNGNNNIAIRALERILRTMLPIIIPINIGGVRDRVEEFINRQLESFFRSQIRQGDSTDGPVSKLAKYPLHYINDIVSDLGVFSGCHARDFLNQLLVQKTGQPTLTFREHFETFGIKLILTGSNLERGTSEYFSKDTTPNMPVADAVRISMSLPFIFKPYRISVRSAAEMGSPALAGLWVDGGVRNNLPIRAFENAPETRPHTLGIRLGEESVRRIDNVLDMFMALSIHQGVLGSGEAEISRTSGYRQQTVILSTSGLSLIDFNPPDAIVQPRITEAQNSIVRYFNPRVPQPESEMNQDAFRPDDLNYAETKPVSQVDDWVGQLLFKLPDDIVVALKARNMRPQYAHDESYSNDLNIDMYSIRIRKYPTYQGVYLDRDKLPYHIRLNINSFIDTSLCDFKPYNPVSDAAIWKSANPRGAVLKLNIKGPDNASVVVSDTTPYGWRFSTIVTPDTGHHPVSGHRDFFVSRNGDGVFFVIKGLDIFSSGVAGLGAPFVGEYGYGQADKLWKSMQTKVMDFINANGGQAEKHMTISERHEWRFVYHRWRNELAKVFGPGAGSAANSSFFDSYPNGTQPEALPDQVPAINTETWIDLEKSNPPFKRTFFPNTNDKSGIIEVEAAVYDLPQGAKYKWSLAKPDKGIIKTPDQLKTKIFAGEPGTTSLQFEVFDRQNKLLRHTSVYLNVPQFFIVTDSHINYTNAEVGENRTITNPHTFDAALRTLQLINEKNIIVAKIKQYTESRLIRQNANGTISGHNVRLLWQLGEFADPLPKNIINPKNLPQPKDSDGYCTVISINGYPQSGGNMLFGLTMPNPDQPTVPTGPRNFNELIMVFTGLFELLTRMSTQSLSAANKDIHDKVVKLIRSYTANSTNITLKNLVVDVFARFYADVICHEIYHSIIYHKHDAQLNVIDPGFDPQGHPLPPAKDIMSSERNFLERTGIEIVDMFNFPAPKSMIIHPFATHSLLDDADSARVDVFFPIPPTYPFY